MVFFKQSYIHSSQELYLQQDMPELKSESLPLKPKLGLKPQKSKTFWELMEEKLGS